ncbi:MAG: TIGR00266 family protein [Bernardetiaceae bacterium]|nr:TIGR00266 family protein [Bernardetiaceae bacterium]
MNSNQINYRIIGSDIQIVEIELEPNRTVIAEAGAMLYMTEGIKFETKMGDGAEANQGFLGKLISAGSRVLTGESLFMTHFSNEAKVKAQVAFGAPFPGTVLPIDLSTLSDNTIVVQKDAFLCAVLGTKISIQFSRRLGAGFFGGEGFILQKLEGNGIAFIHAGGTVVERTLHNETLRVDTGSVVGFEQGIDFDVEPAGNLKSMLWGGEGLFLTTLKGTGKVWLQSMPISKLARALRPSMITSE